MREFVAVAQAGRVFEHEVPTPTARLMDPRFAQLVRMFEVPLVPAVPRVDVQNVDPRDCAGRDCNKLRAWKPRGQLRELNGISGRVEVSV